MISDKDEILKLALQELLDVYLEGAIANKDIYGYWSLLEREILNCSLFSFRRGIMQYQNALVESPSPDLINYDIKLRVRLLNNEFISAATNETIETFRDKVRKTINPNLVFDFEIDDLVGFERVLFLLFTYADKIRLAALATVNENTVYKKRG